MTDYSSPVELEVREAEWPGRHNIYNVVVRSLLHTRDPIRITADALTAEELLTTVETLKAQLDGLVEKAKRAEAKPSIGG